MAYSEALAMQARLLALVKDPQTPSGYAASCARAWDVLEERKRILRGKPLPGQLRPDLEQRKNLRRRKPSSLIALPVEDNQQSKEQQSQHSSSVAGPAAPVSDAGAEGIS
jgi:hypothetical protein